MSIGFLILGWFAGLTAGLWVHLGLGWGLGASLAVFSLTGSGLVVLAIAAAVLRDPSLRQPVRYDAARRIVPEAEAHHDADWIEVAGQRTRARTDDAA